MDIMQPALTRNRSRSLSPPRSRHSSSSSSNNNSNSNNSNNNRGGARASTTNRRSQRPSRGGLSTLLSRGRRRANSPVGAGIGGDDVDDGEDLSPPDLNRQRSRSVSPSSKKSDASAAAGGGGGGGARAGVAAAGGGGGAKRDYPPDNNESGVQRVRVYCRIRPQNREERDHGGSECARVDANDPAAVVYSAGDGDAAGQQAFSFDQCFGQASTNAEIFDQVAKPLVDSALRGVNCALLCYGQTGAGKTFTMFGDTDFSASTRPEQVGGGAKAAQSLPEPKVQGGISAPELPHASASRFQNRGLVNLTMAYLFELREQGIMTKTVKIDVCISCLEVYQNRLFDLLGTTAPEANAEPLDRPFKRPELDIFQDHSKHIAISSGKKVPVKSVPECLQIISQAWENRRVGHTDMNAHSSRSHCLILFSVGSYELSSKTGRFAQLYMVDLAGSEIVSKTKAEGLRLEEAKQINKSLLTLGIIVNKLAMAASSSAGSSQDPVHIPYRDSKLTRLLQNSFGGSAKTCLLVNVSPARFNDSETLSTLRFASRAARIKNNVEATAFKSISALKEILQELQDDQLRLQGRHQRLELLLLLLDGFLHDFAGAEVVLWVQSRDQELVASRQISGSSLDAKLEAASGPDALRGRFDPRSNADDRTTKDMVRAQDLDLELAKSEILRLAETGHGMLGNRVIGGGEPIPLDDLPLGSLQVTSSNSNGTENRVMEFRAGTRALRKLEDSKLAKSEPVAVPGQTEAIDPMESGMRLFARIRPVIGIEGRLDPAGSAATLVSAGAPQPTSLQSLGVKIVDEVEASGAPFRTVRIRSGEGSRSSRSYRVHDAFSPEVGQERCYAQVARPLIEVLSMGRNAAIIAYGQTGSGKTFTMFGEEKAVAEHGATGGASDGIVPRLLRDIFSWVRSSRESDIIRAVRMSCIHIYCEKVLDLTPDPGAAVPLDRCRVCKGRPCVCVQVKMIAPGVTGTTAWQHDVADVAEAMGLIRSAIRGRATGATGSNETSSRSHLIIQVLVLSEDTRTGAESRVQLDLVDLAGSEKISKTGATGDRLEEAKSINRSLYALTGCIDAITKKTRRVPYGDSKLTRLLSSALGGDSLTSIILNLSPHWGNRRETLSTLDFGDNVNRVRCKPMLHREVSAESLNSAIRVARLKFTKLLGLVETTSLRIALRRSVVSRAADRHPSSVFGLAVEAHPEEFLPAVADIPRSSRSARKAGNSDSLLDTGTSSRSAHRPRKATSLSRYFLVQAQYGLYIGIIFTFAGLDTVAFVAPRVCRHWARWLLARPQPAFWRAMLMRDPQCAETAAKQHNEYMQAQKTADADKTKAAHVGHTKKSPYTFHGTFAIVSAARDAAWGLLPNMAGPSGDGIVLAKK